MSNLVLQDDSSVACLLRRGNPTTASLCSRSLRPTWRNSTKRLRENAVVSPEDRLARVSIFRPNWNFWLQFAARFFGTQVARFLGPSLCKMKGIELLPGSVFRTKSSARNRQEIEICGKLFSRVLACKLFGKSVRM